MRRTIVAACIAVAGVVVTSATPAAAADTHNLTNGFDPFAQCGPTSDEFGGQNFPATEPEVWLASDPAIPGQVGGAIQQDRWSDGGAKGLVSITRTPNGTVTETPLPFSVCAEPTYQNSGNVVVDPYAGNGIPTYFDRASDPWVDYGPDGTAYAVSISFDANDNGGGVAAAVSTNGGTTWTHQQVITAENPGDPSLPFNDKESVTADPTTAGRAYAVWDHLDNVACGPVARPSHAPAADDRVNRGSSSNAALDCFVGPAELSFTSNGGQSWSAPQVIVPTPTNEQTIANQVVVNPLNGDLYDLFMYIHADNSLTVEDVISTNQGVSWSAPHVISSAEPVGVTDPASGAPLRTGDIIPEFAIDPGTGELYAVWQDSRATNGAEDGLMISASNNGISWSSPAVVENHGDGAAFTPAIKVLGDHRVAVEYYTFTGGFGGGSHTTGVMRVRPVIRFTAGAGTTFTGVEQPLGPYFNMLAAPFAGGYFTGDYEGLAVDGAHPSTVRTLYTATTCTTTACDAVSGFDGNGNPIASGVPDPTDVFSQLVRDRQAG